MTVEIIIVLALIVANGLFAMAEIAVVSSRRARLQHESEEGDRRAASALELSRHPDNFLATVQVGITLVGILAGAYGGATIARDLGVILDRWPLIAPHGQRVALIIVVAVITYLSLIIGELVPKRIALSAPEKIAKFFAPFMTRLASIARPAVAILSVSTRALSRLVGVKAAQEAPVTEEELILMLHAGTKAGTFHREELEMVEGVFDLADRRVNEVMTPRPDVEWLDLNLPAADIHDAIVGAEHSILPVGEGSLDSILGVLYLRTLLDDSLAGRDLDVRRHMVEPLFVAERSRALRVLELMRERKTGFAIVLNEYGGIEGIVTREDIFDPIIGMGSDEPMMMQRADGTWLVDGAATLAEIDEAIPIAELRGPHFQTIAGFVIDQLGELPKVADTVRWKGWQFEVVDMDGKRIDKILVTPPATSAQ